MNLLMERKEFMVRQIKKKTVYKAIYNDYASSEVKSRYAKKAT
jgi:glycerol-3-phosphate O-acyltransferase